MENKLVEKLEKGIPVIGLNNSCPAANIVERMCRGWDFVWIDAQHGQHSYESVLNAIRAAGTIGIDTVLRVPGHEYGILGPYADTASSAIMVPMVDTRQQAADIVDALRFPPLGKRSYGGRRMIDMYGRSYFKDRKLLVIAQIETLEAVENVDEIIGTDGIDMIFFGPDDMKVRMDIDIDAPVFGNEQLLGAMKSVAKAAKSAGKYAGCVAASPDILNVSYDMGYRLFMCGGDMGFIRSAADKRLSEIRGALEKREFVEIRDTKDTVY